MSAVAANDTATAKEHATAIAEHFRSYNEEFGRITRRAALNFLAEDWQTAQTDAVTRIELYDLRVTRCVGALAGELRERRTDVPLWSDIKRAYEMLVARRPDSDFYRTFFNSVSRELFGTVGVNPEVEFCATNVGRASGAVPLRVYRVGGSLPAAVREIIGDSSITPLVIAFTNSANGVLVDAVMLSRADVGSLFGYARSYFHVDLPVVSAAITLLRSFMPRKPIDELYTVLGRAKQGKTERYFALQRHMSTSIDSFVHAPGERGLVMIVFTLPSHDLVFKVIRDHFGAPKTCTRADVMERYQFVFRHDRAGRLVDAQEFKRLRLPLARFMPALADELLRDASLSCRIEGDDLIVEHCYIERLRPLNLFLREAEPAAAEAAIVDYGNALRDLALSNVFPGDLLLKNFGVTSHRRVIFYDYDELCLVTDCVFRDLPTPTCEEEETSAEPWFHCGPRDVFPEQWLPFLAIPSALRDVFLKHHADLLTAAWWRSQPPHSADANHYVLPTARAAPAA